MPSRLAGVGALDGRRSAPVAPERPDDGADLLSGPAWSRCLPPWSRELLIGSTQILALLVPVAMVLLLVRTPRLLAMAVGSALTVGIVLAAGRSHIEVAIPRRVELATTRESWIFGAAFPSGAYLAGFTAVVIVLGPVLSRGWRRAAIGGLGLASLARCLSSGSPPTGCRCPSAGGLRRLHRTVLP